MGVKYGSEREKELEEKLQGEKRVKGGGIRRRDGRPDHQGWVVGEWEGGFLGEIREKRGKKSGRL